MDVEVAREGVDVAQRSRRAAILATIGPLVILAGVVWAIAQPYRLALLSETRSGVWDHIAQPPLLVLAVGLFFEVAVARPLRRQLEEDR